VKVGFRESFLKDLVRVKDKRLLQRVRATIESEGYIQVFSLTKWNSSDLVIGLSPWPWPFLFNNSLFPVLF